VFPSTACLVQARLGANGCPAFDVQAVCSGFVYALALADSLVRAGQARTALIIGSEVFSRILDWSDRSTCVLFGDGAGAVVLRADTRPGVLGSVLHADGSQAGILSTPGNVSGGSVIGVPFLRMDGQAVFKLAVKVLDEVARETVARCGLTLEDVDWLIPHQANVRILEATAKRLKIPRERLIVTVDQHANTSAASVPLALDAAVRDGRIRAGHRVMLQGVGGGFTWGATLVEM
jgi:3-oxoacyl-[acyl-carrier-protein] synthase-3